MLIHSTKKSPVFKPSEALCEGGGNSMNYVGFMAMHPTWCMAPHLFESEDSSESERRGRC